MYGFLQSLMEKAGSLQTGLTLQVGSSLEDIKHYAYKDTECTTSAVTGRCYSLTRAMILLITEFSQRRVRLLSLVVLSKKIPIWTTRSIATRNGKRLHGASKGNPLQSLLAGLGLPLYQTSGDESVVHDHDLEG
ncbi:hypothetical protein O6H91_23G042200 [Diphasiastrum complanatum]|uniref:Uncharacterized protein n=1 Tax=Diphasiastrum complanatum TaxID=34168 RepID=A0ACC2A9Z9_DIPCM|nr:hypothetical protein O6H91_23G042200 [Diphasiastrum complanatum]